MVKYNSQICKEEKKFKIQYETNNVENYKHIQEEIRKQIDKEEDITDWLINREDSIEWKEEK